MQTPSIGRIVHYVLARLSPIILSARGEHIAAVIASVQDSDQGVVDLTCFPSSQQSDLMMFRRWGVQYDAKHSEDTWHYPEHVGTVQWHESEDDEASRREGPISNSPEIEEKDYPDPEKNNDEDYEDVTREG